MNADCVVVDANIAFKALASGRGDLRDRLGLVYHGYVLRSAVSLR